MLVSKHPAYWFRRYHPLFGLKWIQDYYFLLPADAGALSVLKALGWSVVFAFPMFIPDLLAMGKTGGILRRNQKLNGEKNES